MFADVGSCGDVEEGLDAGASVFVWGLDVCDKAAMQLGTLWIAAEFKEGIGPCAFLCCHRMDSERCRAHHQVSFVMLVELYVAPAASLQINQASESMCTNR